MTSLLEETQSSRNPRSQASSTMERHGRTEQLSQPTQYLRESQLLDSAACDLFLVRVDSVDLYHLAFLFFRNDPFDVCLFVEVLKASVCCASCLRPSSTDNHRQLPKV